MANLIKVITVVLLTMVFSLIHAQKSGDFKDLKSALNKSNLYTKDVDDTNIFLGFHLGWFTKLQLRSKLFLQPGLRFTIKAAEITYKNALAEGIDKFVFDYIENPLLLTTNFTENFNIHIRTYGALSIDSKIKNKSQDELFCFKGFIDKDDLNTLEYGLLARIGF